MGQFFVRLALGIQEFKKNKKPNYYFFNGLVLQGSIKVAYIFI